MLYMPTTLRSLSPHIGRLEPPKSQVKSQPCCCRPAGASRPLPVQANGISHYFRPCSAPAPALKRMRPSSGQASLPSLLGSQSSQPSHPSSQARLSQPDHVSSQAGASQPCSQSQPSSQSQGLAPCSADVDLSCKEQPCIGSAPSSLSGFARRTSAFRAPAADRPRSSSQQCQLSEPGPSVPLREQGPLPIPAANALPAAKPFHSQHPTAQPESKLAADRQPAGPFPGTGSHAAHTQPRQAAARQPALPAQPRSGSRFAAFRFQPEAKPAGPAAPAVLQQQQQQQAPSRKRLGANAAAALLRRTSASALPSGLHHSLQPAAACQAARSASQGPMWASAEPQQSSREHLRRGSLPDLSSAAGQQQQGFLGRPAASRDVQACEDPWLPTCSAELQGLSGEDEGCDSRPCRQPEAASGSSPSMQRQLRAPPGSDGSDADSTLSPAPAPWHQVPAAWSSPSLSPPAACSAGGSADLDLQLDSPMPQAPSEPPSPLPSQMCFTYEAPSPGLVPASPPDAQPSPQAAGPSAAAAASSCRASGLASSSEGPSVSPVRRHPLAWATCKQPRLQQSKLRRRGSAQVRPPGLWLLGVACWSWLMVICGMQSMAPVLSSSPGLCQLGTVNTRRGLLGSGSGFDCKANESAMFAAWTLPSLCCVA